MLMQASGKPLSVTRLLSLLLILTLGCPAIAQMADSSPLAKEFTGITASDLDEIRQELEKVKSQNSRMKEEIDILRAETQQDWMTEQRPRRSRSSCRTSSPMPTPEPVSWEMA